MCALLIDNPQIRADTRVCPYRPRILLKQVDDPHRFGVAELEGDKVVRIIEKPKAPPSNYAVTGIYMFDSQVFDFIKTLSPSQRGELEITDVNNLYINQETMTWSLIDGWWPEQEQLILC